jgi:hypothetical protein
MTDAFERRAAEVVLAGLHAILPIPSEGSGGCYRLLPDQMPVDREAVLEAIIAAPKPLSCAAIGYGGCLGVILWPGVGKFGTAGPNERDRAVEAWHTRQRASNPLRRPAARLRFAAGPESAVMTLAEYDVWREQYRVLGLNIAIDYGATDGDLGRAELSRILPSRAGDNGGQNLRAVT